MLIDGYRRVAALRHLGRDIASVERWACDVTDALLGLLARTQDRPLESIEEALFIRELMQGLGLSQHDLARRCGRVIATPNGSFCDRLQPVNAFTTRRGSF